MKCRIHTGLITLALLGSGCELFMAKETAYLQSAQGRATQEEVRQQMGPPRFLATTPSGETLWVYRVWQIEPGGQNVYVSAGSWCDEYALSFDKQGILRTWTHKSEKHGGELMPTYCVTDGFKPML